MTKAPLFTELSRQFAIETPYQIFALVDAAQFQAIWPALKHRYKEVQWLSLLENTGSQDAIKAGPLLLLIDEQQNDALEWLFEQSRNGYFLSWMSSRLPFTELRDHLSSLLDVEIEDAGNWVMRYFDTRILPVWYSVLTGEQKAQVSSPIQVWGYIDRYGQAQHIKGAGQDAAPPSKTFKLIQTQERVLLDAAYPDAILEQLHNNENADLSALAKVQQYAFVAKQIKKAQTQYQIEATPDMVLFCTLALAEGNDFDMKSPYQAILASSLNGEGHFGDLFIAQNNAG